MKRIIIVVILSSLGFGAMAQSRFYINGGFSSTGSLTFQKPRKLPLMGIDWEHKLAGSFHSVVGINYFQTRYDIAGDPFTPGSNFRGKYVGAPLLLRLNVRNKNRIYIDAGPCPYVLLKATLSESVERFNGKVDSQSADITKYSDRLFLSFLFQATYAVNRFTFTVFYQWQGGDSSSGTLADHWFLNAQESTYLGMGGYSNFKMIGFKAGVRIR